MTDLQNIKVQADRKLLNNYLAKIRDGKTLSHGESKAFLQLQERLGMAETAEAGPIVTTEQVCMMFGVTKQAIDKWLRKGCPKESHDAFRVIPLVQWWINRKTEEPDAADSKDRYWNAKAGITEIALKQASGALVKADFIEKLLADEGLALRNAFMTMPRKLAPRLYGIEPRDIEIELYEEIRQILTRFARRAEQIKETRDAVVTFGGEDHEDVDAVAEPTARTTRQRVGRGKPSAATGKQRGGGAVAKRPRAVSAGDHGRVRKPRR